MGQYKTLPVCAESHKGRSVCFTNTQVLKLLLYSKPESLLSRTQECTGDINLANLSGPLAAGGVTHPRGSGIWGRARPAAAGADLGMPGISGALPDPCPGQGQAHPSLPNTATRSRGCPPPPAHAAWQRGTGGTVQRCPGDNRAGTATHAPGAAASLLCPCGNERLQWVTYKGM